LHIHQLFEKKEEQKKVEKVAELDSVRSPPTTLLCLEKAARCWLLAVASVSEPGKDLICLAVSGA
jgi:hypothetical protein